MSDRDRLRAEVQRWIEDDPDPGTRAELAELLAAGDLPALQVCFTSKLGFGTAGLRAELGAGPARINRAVVARATAGFVNHLLSTVPQARQRGLCVGYDARHGSRALAEETAAVAAGLGLRVHLFARPGPTPLLSFAVRERKAAGGVMITASHNPARDNGYKVYAENGAQLTPELERAVAAAMDAVASLRALPRLSPAERAARDLQTALDGELERRYLDGVARLVGGRVPGAAELRLVYTALHGVGGRLVNAALSEAGFVRVSGVAEQAEPDPDFPTVAFPNPEEVGAMDQALALGQQLRADLVVANDPDADRLALAARDQTGGLRMLTGNQVGVLLADHLLSREPDAGPRAIVSSIVSTPMIASVARAHGAHWEPTLTGFKWIANRGQELEREQALRFVFGFEEALGYAAGTWVGDKDGIATAVLAARLAAELKAQGRTLHDALGELFRRHGVYLSDQLSLRLERDDQRRLMQRARDAPPRSLAGLPLVAALDLMDATTRGTPSLSLALPASDVLLWELAGGHRVCLRPSGTEPKLKLYVDVREPVQDAEPLEDAQARATRTLAHLLAALRERFAA